MLTARAVLLDLKSFRLTGEAVTIADGVRSSGANGLFQFAVSGSGVVSFRAGGGTASQLAWLDRSGRQISTVGPVGDYLNPELSPDDTRVAFERGGAQGDRDIWILDLNREVPTRFTRDPATVPFSPARFSQGNGRLSPDGRWIAYASTDSGAFQIVLQSFPSAAGGQWPVSADGGDFLRWRRRDGQELHYLAPNGALMAVAVGATGAGSSAAPRSARRRRCSRRGWSPSAARWASARSTTSRPTDSDSSSTSKPAAPSRPSPSPSTGPRC